jgi:serine/threonine protein kinase
VRPKGNVLTSLKASHVGERLDRFELIAEIASGGMATVFLARLEGVAGFQRLYAIKRLHPHLANEGEFVDMFLDEARLAARIHHPNVVSILEVGTSEQGYYLVMEYIEGDTAARLLARASQVGGRLPPATAIRIALDTLNGLHAAHELTDDEGQPLHIVHRDVSPQNILVGIDGASRITDFGVAHAATRLSSTRTGQLKGKLAYMAPEQARGANVDRRSDVFAMGVVLWEMLAGKRLFKASNDAETLHRILFAPMPTLRGAGIDIPMPLDAVCAKALEREQENRYGSAAEFADELERVARSLGLLATTRDIASYIDGTMGAEISQQREVVRMWLSRSEPSRNDRISVSGLEGSRGPRRPSVPLHGHAGTPPPPPMRRLASRDVTLAGTPSSSAALRAPPLPPQIALKRSEVSSVSSAVLEMPEATTTDSRVLFAQGTGTNGLVFSPKKRRRRVLVSIAAFSAVLTMAGVWLLWPHATPAHRVSAASGESVPVAEKSGAQGAVPATAKPFPSATAAPSARPTTAGNVAAGTDAGATSGTAAPATPQGSNARSSGSPSGPKVSPGTASPHPKRPVPAGTNPPDDLSDDLSHNPYR